MNLILIEPGELAAPNLARISGRKLEHITGTLKKKVAESCKIGVLNGGVGRGTLRAITAEYAEIELTIESPPPEKRPITLIMALPRPKTFRKVLHAAVTIGVKEIYFIGCFKVEKSYWQSPFLAAEYIHELMMLALEQAADTVPCAIHFHRFFKPFAEDIMPQISCNKNFIVFHPGGETWNGVSRINEHTILCFGPEGGFTEYEVQLLKAAKAECISLGNRILRTEVALPFALGKLS